jgi:hypothetical protein
MGIGKIAGTFVGYEKTCIWNCKKKCINQLVRFFHFLLWMLLKLGTQTSI